MRRKKEDNPLEINAETERDFLLVVDDSVEVVPNNGQMVYEPLGIRSADGVIGAQLESLVHGYEQGAYMDTFLEIRRTLLQTRTTSLGCVKISIASHIRWWLAKGRLPSEGDKRRMKAAFIGASKANTVTESYFSFCCEVVKEIHGELPDEELVEKVRLYTGEDAPMAAGDEGYSGLNGTGWYPALSMKSLTRLPNTGGKLYPPLGLMCPKTGD